MRQTLGSAVYLLLLLLLTVTTAAHGQQPDVARMEAGPAGEHLDRLAGVWKTHRVIDFRGEQIVEEGVEEYAWLEPTRVWLMKQVSDRDHPILGEMNGVELWAYDARSGEVVKYWFDSQSAEVFPNRGRWTDDETLELNGMIIWEGREIHLRNVLEFRDEDHFVWTHYQSWDTDDDFQQRSEVEYSRQTGDGGM